MPVCPSTAFAPTLAPCPSAPPRRRMLTLAQELTSWANKAAATNLAHILPGLVSHIPWLPQLDGACTTLAAMALLASKLDVQSSAAFRIVAACQLVFDVGRRVIAAKTAEVEAAVSAGIQPDQFLLLRLAILSDAQLAAVAGATRLLQQEAHSSAAAAFARSTARPSVLLPWMVAMLEGLALSTRTDTLQAADLGGHTRCCFVMGYYAAGGTLARLAECRASPLWLCLPSLTAAVPRSSSDNQRLCPCPSCTQITKLPT